MRRVNWVLLKFWARIDAEKTRRCDPTQNLTAFTLRAITERVTLELAAPHIASNVSGALIPPLACSMSRKCIRNSARSMRLLAPP